MTESDLHDMELIACQHNQPLMYKWAADLIVEVRKLQHELANPNYLYAGGRIHRQALISRDNYNQQLFEENSELKRQLEKLQPEDVRI